MGHAPDHAPHDAAHLAPGERRGGLEEQSQRAELAEGGEDAHLGVVPRPFHLAPQVLEDAGVGCGLHGVEVTLVLPGVAVVVGEDLGGDDLIGQLRLPHGAEAATPDQLDELGGGRGWGGGGGREEGGGTGGRVEGERICRDHVTEGGGLGTPGRRGRGGGGGSLGAEVFGTHTHGECHSHDGKGKEQGSEHNYDSNDPTFNGSCTEKKRIKNEETVNMDIFDIKYISSTHPSTKIRHTNISVQVHVSAKIIHSEI